MRKILLVLSAFLLVVLIAAASLCYFLVYRPLPKTDGIIALTGLSAPVRIYRDRWGVPHLFAETEQDLFMAQGFVQAQDRMWQMEANRRLAAGRLSEILGKEAVEIDRFCRTVGFMRAAKAEWAETDARPRALMESYAAGVNAYLSVHRDNLPLEFRLLSVSPEPWQPTDSIAWGKFMAFMGSKNWQEEIVRAMLVHKFGPKKAADLLERIDPLRSGRSGVSLDLTAALPRHLFRWPAIAGGGSNNWVVAGNRSATGAPLLANDMHLPLGVPSIWYEMHLSGGDLDVIGLSMAGTPLIVAGHNRHLAWGITFAYIDNQDLYVERLHPTDGRRYLFRESWREPEVIEEPIRVKGEAEPVRHRVWKTVHGPLVNLTEKPVQGRGQALALKWTAQQPGAMIENIYRINRASSVEEFFAAAADWTEPAVNLVVADTAGNIGYILGARVPIRGGDSGVGPFAGWTGASEWKGILPAKEMPAAMNPPEGFWVTANDRITVPKFDRYLSADFAPGHRAERIRQVLSGNYAASVEGFRSLQGDLACIPARRFLDAVQLFKPRDPASRELMARLRQWDRRMAPDSVGAAVYAVLFYRLLENTFRDEMGDLTERFFGIGVVALQPLNRFSGHSRTILISLLEEPGSVWFDDTRTENRETLGPILEKSLAETADFLTRRLGPDMNRWTWGRLHQVNIPHPLGRVKPLDRIFNVGPFDGSGHFCTVAQSSVMPGMDFSLDGWAVSNRHIYDLSNWDKSIGNIVPGQSGMFGSRHYKDQVDLWRKVEPHPLYFSREKVKKNAAQVLELTPQ